VEGLPHKKKRERGGAAAQRPCLTRLKTFSVRRHTGGLLSGQRARAWGREGARARRTCARLRIESFEASYGMSLEGISSTDGTGLVYASIRCRISSAICSQRDARPGRCTAGRRAGTCHATHVLGDEHNSNVLARRKVLEGLFDLTDRRPWRQRGGTPASSATLPPPGGRACTYGCRRSESWTCAPYPRCPHPPAAGPSPYPATHGQEKGQLTAAPASRRPIPRRQ
jgi:hypothetical protein